MTESVNMLQSTDEDKRRLAEEVEKVTKMMAGMGKQATGGDLQRVAEMEESLKKLEEEVQAKDVDKQEIMTNFEDKGEKKVTREGGGCAGLVQGRDETHKLNKTSGKGKGKGNGGKGEHGGKGHKGGKGHQQSTRTTIGEEELRSEENEKQQVRRSDKNEKQKELRSEEEDEQEEDGRVQVAPNMGAGGSYPQATLDPEEGEAAEEEWHESRKEQRIVRWIDCSDEEQSGAEESAGRAEKSAGGATRMCGGSRGARKACERGQGS